LEVSGKAGPQLIQRRRKNRDPDATGGVTQRAKVGEHLRGAVEVLWLSVSGRPSGGAHGAALEGSSISTMRNDNK